MPFLIYNKDVLVSTERAIVDVDKYFKNHRPDVKGFSLRTLKTNNKWSADFLEDNIYKQKYEKGDYKIIREREQKYKRADKEITKAKTVTISNFRKDIVFEEEGKTINIYNMYQLLNKIINKIKSNLPDDLRNNYFNITLEGHDFEQESTDDNGEPIFKRVEITIGTKFLNINLLFEDMYKKLMEWFQQYSQQDFTMDKVIIGKTASIPTPNLIIWGSDKQYKSYIVSINKLIENMILTNECNKKLIKIAMDYVILRPRTIKNCLISASYMALKNRYNVESVMKKFLDRHPIENYELETQAKHISKHLKTKIKIYVLNGELEHVTYDEGTNEKYIKILIIGSHAHALIPKENIKKFDTEELKELLKYRDEDEEEILVEKKECKTNKDDYVIGTYDFETCDGTVDNKAKEDTIPYALGLYFGLEKREEDTQIAQNEYYEEFYKKNSDDNIVIRFLDYLDKSPHEKLLLYAHNGGKFDIYILIREIFWRKNYVVTEFLEQMGRIINMHIMVFDKGKVVKDIIFRDSYNFISCSLNDACESFKPPTVKLEGDVDHNLINVNNCCSKEIKEYTQHYLKNDCVSLYEILHIYDGIINERFNISIKNVLTNAGITRKVFLDNFYKPNEYPIYSLPKSADTDIRKYYFGGRNECMTKLGHRKGKFYYLDFTSLYPYMMQKHKFQYGNLNVIDIEEEDNRTFNDEWFGFVKCRFRHVKKDEIPLHAVLSEHKLMFPYCDTWQESVLSTEEIKYSIDNNIGYEYQYIKVYNYEKKDYIFKECVEDLYKMKLDAENNNQEALRNIAKILINSLYGFWGINYYNRDQIEIVKIRKQKETKSEKAKTVDEVRSYKLQTLLMNQKLNDYNIIGRYDVYNKVDKIKANCANVGIASMVTSYARMHLYKLLKDIKDHGGKTYYMDTDSVVTDYNIYENPEMVKKWIGSGGKLIGELKNETGLPTGYYTELITLGNKFYALRNTELKKKSVILKMKGVNSKASYINKHIDHKNKLIVFSKLDRFNGKEKITFDDYILMDKGYTLQCDNMNFISGINEVIVKGNKLTKMSNNKCVKKLYDKGVIDGKNNITPLTL